MALHRALRQSPIDNALLTQAESGLKRAAQRDPKSAMPHYYLGRIYETRNQIAEAERAYRNASKSILNTLPRAIASASASKIAGAQTRP